MWKYIRTNRFVAISVFLILIFHFFNNYIWLKSDSISTGHEDAIWHLDNQFVFFNALKNTLSLKGVEPLLILRNLFNIVSGSTILVQNWPPLVYFITSLFNLVFGYSFFMVRFLQINYFIILLISTYKIGSVTYNRKAGLLAMLILSLYPAIFGISRMYELDFPLAAAVCFCMYLLLVTNFENRWKSLLFGAVLGLSILIKGQVIFFIGAPISYIFLISLRKKNDASGRAVSLIGNLVISISTAMAISSIWWLKHVGLLFRELYEHFIVFYVPPHQGSFHIYNAIIDAYGYIPFKPFGFNWFFYYLYMTVARISPLFFLVFIFGLYFFLRSKKIKLRNFILIWVICPYMVLTLLSYKWERYYFPSFPALALISAVGLLELKNKITRRFLISLVVMIGLFQFFELSFGKEQLLYPLKKDWMRVGDWNHPPYDSNLEEVVRKFIKAIKMNVREDVSFPGRIAILGGKEDILKYFIRVHMPNSLVYRGCDIGELQRQSKDLDFLIVLGAFPDSKDGFIDLIKNNKAKSSVISSADEEMLRGLLNIYKDYKVINEDILQPDGVRIALLSK